MKRRGVEKRVEICIFVAGRMVLFLGKGVVLAFETPIGFWDVNLRIFRYHDIHL